MWNAIWRFITSGPVKALSAFIVAVLGIYGTFFYEKKAIIDFEIIANSSVLDVRESLSQLVITYAGTDLQEKNQNLYLLAVRISNNGSKDIVKTDFDDSEPLGFRISSGEILETPKIVGDNYLEKNLKPTVKQSHEVIFSPVILNAGDSFEARTLLLVERGVTPKISSIGKVAGVTTIKISEPYRDLSNQTYLEEAFKGKASIQIGRWLGYTFGGLALILVFIVTIIVPTTFAFDYFAKKERKKKVRLYKKTANKALNLKEDFLMTKYIEAPNEFQFFESVANGETNVIAPGIEGLRTITTEGSDGVLIQRVVHERAERTFIKAFDEAGILIIDGPQISIDPDVEVFAKEFISYIS